MRWFFVTVTLPISFAYFLMWHTPYAELWAASREANPSWIAGRVAEAYRQPLALAGVGACWMVLLLNSGMGSYLKNWLGQRELVCGSCRQSLEDVEAKYCPSCDRYI